MARAVRLIRDGAVDRGGVETLAAELGYSTRQLGRLIHAELGAGPLALARTERVRTARTLIEVTSMPMSDIAFAAGFSSIRQFNDTFREMYSISPRQLRSPGTDQPVADELNLRLAYRPPSDFSHLLEYFAVRAVPGIETVADGAYTRSLRLPHGPAVITVRQGAGDFVDCRLRLADTRDLGSAVARTRRTFDLDADPRRWQRLCDPQAWPASSTTGPESVRQGTATLSNWPCAPYSGSRFRWPRRVLTWGDS
ncbi:AlkA N-terminal domain-containing protein [Brevibacterium linens]|uniref:AlkA N-terminal domain-containing protein n=1 Tax=Brevibacterium linens TaxID=1703 RepID=UPI001F49F68E|nr:AlkA N-terminal domain-containing protein [Brevibacterium linens]